MKSKLIIRSDQTRSVAQLCPTLWDTMNCSTPGLLFHHQLPEFTETHVHRVSDAIQPSHPLSSPSPPAPNRSQHQTLFQWVNFAWGGQSTGVSALASLYPYTFFSTVIMALRLYAMNVHKRHDELARGFRIWRLIIESWLCFIPVYLRCVSLLDVCFPFYKVGII